MFENVLPMMEMVTPDTGRDRDRAALYPVACQRQLSRPWAAAAAVTNRATSRRRPDAVAGAARRRTGVIPCDRAAISWRFSLRSVARVYPNKSLPDTSHGTVLSTAAGACRAVLPPHRPPLSSSLLEWLSVRLGKLLAPPTS